jgi:uncharacterized protein (DUF305 family)
VTSARTNLSRAAELNNPLPQSRWARLLAGVLAALMLIGVGVAGGYLGSQLRQPGDDSVDAGFARDMSTHHAQAVEMAMFAFQKGSTDDLRVIGFDMATTQQYQIGVMQSWLQEWNLEPSSSRPRMAWMADGATLLLPDGRMPGMATNEDVDKLKASAGKEFDILFCQLMLRHHLGGLHMAEEAKAHADDKRVRTLAQAMYDAQSFEVTLLTDKLKQLGAGPAGS